MSGLLEGHLAVVTGGASGIGRAIAKGYAEQGAHIVILDMNLEGAAEVGKEILDAGGEAWSFKLDVTDRQQCYDLSGQIEEKIGNTSILVNNAGINRRNAFTADAEDVFQDWDDLININLSGVFNVTHAIQKQIRSTKGRVVNIGSIQSFLHVRTPNSPAYTTSKHGVLGFTKALAAELGKDGVRVNAIGPGPTLPSPRQSDNEFRRQAKSTLLQRVVDVEDIARAVAFILETPSLTGQMVALDSGQHLVIRSASIPQ